MLVELAIENFAVVERLRVRFHPGFNLLTGETGSGKSIVVDALGLLFGGRASADMIRSGESRARVAGLFDAHDAGLKRVLDEAGIEAEDGELLVEREIQANGKSRAFVGSRLVTASLLRDLAPHLGDIHGQHDQQMLFSPSEQRDMLDRFAKASALRESLATVFRKWVTCGAELGKLAREEQERLRLADLWRFQLREIEGVDPKPQEDAALERERKVLSNVTRLADAATAAYTALYDAPDAAVMGLRIASKKIEELSRIDGSFGTTLESLRGVEIAVNDAAHTLRDYLGRLEADPQRLEEIETRLAALDKLKRKYGPGLDGVETFLEEVRGNLDGAETADDRARALRDGQAQLAREFESLAAELREKRQRAADRLSRAVEDELAALAMAGTTFRVALAPAEWSESGADHVEFLVSANRGEEPRPMAKVASGGELSRIALALKGILTGAATTHGTARTVVFDEVDAGIGGVAAEQVGQRLKAISAANQVLCVTHLAQIASFGDHHYVVEKRESKGRTVAVVDEVTGETRIREIGRMLAGQRLTPEALKHAEQLLAAGSGR